MNASQPLPPVPSVTLRVGPSIAFDGLFDLDELHDCHKQFASFAGDIHDPDTRWAALEWLRGGGNAVCGTFLTKLRGFIPDADPAGSWTSVNAFERMLLEHAATLNSMICDLAAKRREHACNALWREAIRLCTAFLEQAPANPEGFKGEARRSLYMPSLRAANPGFSANATRIAELIELSKQTVQSGLTDNRSVFGAMCARLVGECVNEIMCCRQMWRTLHSHEQDDIEWPTLWQASYFQNLTQTEMRRLSRMGSRRPGIYSQLALFAHIENCGRERMHFLSLPELAKSTAKCWWKEAVEKMVEDQFPKLLEQPDWLRELRAVSTGTEADMRKELKDYTREKVRQFAPA